MKYYKCEKCELNYVLEKGQICEICQKNNLEDPNYCLYCGARIEENEELCEDCKESKKENDFEKILKEEDIYKMFF